MAKISIGGTGTVDDKNKQTTTTTTTTTTGNGIKPNLPTLPAGNKDSVMTNTDGGGAAVPKTETPVTPATGGGTGTKAETPTTTVTVGSGSYTPLASTKTEETVTETGPAASEKAETALADLRNQYSERLRGQYDYAADKMKAERDEALRENWILQQQAEAALPEQMAARGITGGATETSLANLIAKYQGNRNDIRGNYMTEMGDLAQSHNEKQAEAERSYNEQWLDYLMYLAKLEEEHKKNLELAKIK